MGRAISVVLPLLFLSQLIAADETPAVQFKIYLKEWGAAARGLWEAESDEARKACAERVVKITPGILELAEKNPKDPIALNALVQVVTQDLWLENNTLHQGFGKNPPSIKAIELLLRDHVQSNQMVEACKRVHYGFRKECETFLRTVLAQNPHKEVQAMAALRLPQFLNSRLRRLDLLQDQDAIANRYEGLFGKEYLASLRRQDRASSIKEIETLFEQAAAKFGDVKIQYGGTVAEQVKSELFEIRHLSLGKPAPEIEGHDQDGNRFKLSDYQGKAVLLYFWSEY